MREHNIQYIAHLSYYTNANGLLLVVLKKRGSVYKSLVGRGRTVTVGRTSVVWLCGLDGWSQTRAGCFRALKKTLEAPYSVPK